MGNDSSTEIILLFPNSGLQLCLIPPADSASPDDPDFVRANELYARCFPNWTPAYDYLRNNYGSIQNKALIFLELQGRLIGGMIVVFGKKDELARHLVNCMANSANKFPNELFFQEIFQKVKDECQYEDVVEIAELFVEEGVQIRALIRNRYLSLLRDLRQHPTNLPVSHTAAVIHELLATFRSSNPHKKGHKALIHNTYRVCTLSLLLSGMVYGQQLLNGRTQPTTCLQWTTSDIQMYQIFKRVCSNQSRLKVARFFDRKLFRRVRARIPALNNLLSLVQNSSIMWEGEFDDRTYSEPYRALISQTPLYEAVSVISNWDSYRFVMRMQAWGPMVNTLKRRRQMQNSKGKR